MFPGILLSHAAILEATTNYKLIQSHDIVLCFSQLYWISGLMTLIRGSLFGSMRIITTERFTINLIFRLISQYKISFVMSPSSHLISMLEYPSINDVDLSSIRHFVVGGNKLPLDFSAECNQRMQYTFRMEMWSTRWV